MLAASLQFIRHLWQSRRLIVSLTRDDFRARYLATYLGLTWALVQPLSFIALIWFVFEVGLRGGMSPSGDVPFILWLACGIVPWFFFTDALNHGSNAVVTNSFLVKRVRFRVSVLPVVSLGSALVVHAVLVVTLLAMFLLYGYKPTLYWLQIPFYSLCAALLALGISWFTSAVIVFVRDVRHVITIIITFGFWLTPILWPIDHIPPLYQNIAALNPMHHVVAGFRQSLIDGVWLWQTGGTLYLLATVVVALALGGFVFRRLRPHFADVL